MRVSRRRARVAEIVGEGSCETLSGILATLKKCPPLRFDPSLEIIVHTNIQTKKVEQQVRGSAFLPHGSGRTPRIAVHGEKEETDKAIAAGAIAAGGEEFLKRIEDGWVAFDILLTTPTTLSKLSTIGKMLGPKGLMPSQRNGTVTANPAQTVRELLTGRINFATDKRGIIAKSIGKLSFSDEKLLENVNSFISAVEKASTLRPLIRDILLSATMAPAIKVPRTLIGHA